MLHGQFAYQLQLEQGWVKVALYTRTDLADRVANALPIEGWTSDPNDEALLQSIPVLDSLRFVNDVRRILGIRGFA